MRTGQVVRVQPGTGPGSGGGRRGQTVHVRAPGGGGLFEHGVVLTTSGAGTSSAQRPFDAEAVWDTDGYFDADWNPYIVRIPAGLAGVYLLLASIPYSGSSDQGANWWKQWINVSGATRDLNDVAQWQQGYRAFNVLRSAGSFAQMVAIVVLEEDDWVDLDSEDHLTSAIIEGGGTFSAFRLGAVGEEGLHGALTYVDQEFGGATWGSYFDWTFGPFLFDTDSYASTYHRLKVPTGLGGLYVMCASRRFRVATLASWSTPAPFGHDFSQIPIFMSDVTDHGAPLDCTTAYPGQAMVSGVDILDCETDSNEVALTSFWLGRLEPDERIEMAAVGIPVLGNPIITDMDPAMTYFALVRIAE